MPKVKTNEVKSKKSLLDTSSVACGDSFSSRRNLSFLYHLKSSTKVIVLSNNRVMMPGK